MPADDDVLELVHRLMHDYRSLQYRLLRDGPHEITHMEGKVLGFFHRHPGATQKELAQHSGRDKAQMARLIAGLRERGLIDAEVDEADRRNVKLSLSAAGLAVHRGLQQQAKRLSAKAVSGLGTAEKEQLLALLRRVRQNLAK
ncbi:MarR family winged helix-turn-helix transcriptional regulator [Ramlibacter sp. WS9]|uniref:MarR family winged helix-turn-helix transcriptional regulator n=1 Tax=Ramlibacter sp. WS9 TaxID=1882741 RepID=UPI003512B04A